MQRRQFIGCAGIASMGALAARTPAAAQEGGQQVRVEGVKITVLKRSIQTDFQEFRDSEIRPCSRFQEGQEFAVEVPWFKPEGFCDWAWGDIRTFIQIVHNGGMDSFVACCTDGFRPVFFKLERLTE